MSSPPPSPEKDRTGQKRKRRGSTRNGKQVAESDLTQMEEDLKRQRKRLKRLQKAAKAKENAETPRQESGASESETPVQNGEAKENRKTTDGKTKPGEAKKDKEARKKKQDRNETNRDVSTSVKASALPQQASTQRTTAPFSTTPLGHDSMEIDPSSTGTAVRSDDTRHDQAPKATAEGDTGHPPSTTPNTEAALSDLYGPAEPVTSRADKLYATVYYPERTEPLKVPSGELSPRARATRYEDMTPQDVATRIAEHEKACKKCPLVFQEAFKGTARGLFDREVHVWLVPILWNYHNRVQRQDRIRFLQSTVRDIFQTFKDLHPDFLKLKDVEMELEYQLKIRNRISSAYYQIARTMKIPGKLEFIDKEVVKYLVEGGHRPRPHDLWAKAEIAKGQDDGEGLEGEDAIPTYVKEWAAEATHHQQTMSKKKWHENRLQIEQDFRKNMFEALNETEKAFWVAQANVDEKPVDEMAALARGLPFVTLVLDRFSKLTGVPLLVMLGAPDYNDPGKLLVYHDLYNHGAPVDIPDFWSGPDQFGERCLLPKWRGYVEEFYKRKPGESAFQSLPMPVFVEPEPEELGAPPPELPPAMVIEIPWTSEPENWAVESKEKTAFKNNLHRGLADSFKKTFHKTRVDFNALAQKPLDFVECERIPVCTKFSSFKQNGTMTLDNIPEGHHADLALPTNPNHMPPHHLHAFYHNIFDTDVPDEKRFRWKTASAAGKYIPPTILLGASQSNATAPNPSGRKQNTPATSQRVKPSAEPKSKRSSAKPVSEEESTTSTDSETPSSDESSDDEDTASESSDDAPLTAGNQGRQPVKLKSGRLSRAPNADMDTNSGSRSVSQGNGKGKAVDPAERASTSGGSQRKAPTTVASTSAPQMQRETASNGPVPPPDSTRTVYRYRPGNAKVGKLVISNYHTHVACLKLQESGHNLAGLSRLPALHELIQRCAELDCTFPATQTPPPLPWQLESLPPKVSSFIQELNSPSRPIPTFLQFAQAHTAEGIDMGEGLINVTKHAEQTVDYLEGLNLAEPGPKKLPSFASWTSIFLVGGRCLAFLSRTPVDDHPDIVQRFKLAHRRIVDLAVIHLIIRYCASTVSGIISVLPSPTSRSTIANAPAVLGAAWLRYLASLSRPLNKLNIDQVLGSNWAVQANPSAQKDLGFPFFSLDSASLRWMSFNRTSKLEAEILKLLKLLQRNQDLGNLTVFQQFTLLGSVFAIHTGPTRKTNDEHWLQAIDTFQSCIDKLAVTPSYETMQLNPPPPPTLIAPVAPIQTALPTEMSNPSPLPNPAPSAPFPEVPPASPYPAPSIAPVSTPVNPVPVSQSGATPRPSTPSQTALPTNCLSLQSSSATQHRPSGAEAPPQKPKYKQPRKKTERAWWIPGDVIRLVHNAKIRDAMVRQKGPRRSNLVLTSPESRNILLRPDGSDAPPPAFSSTLLVTPGPQDPHMHPDCFVHEQPLPPFIPFEEIASGRYDAYFKELFEKNPEESVPSDADEVDAYEEYETAERLKNLLLDRSRRDQFRAQFDLPVSEYDTTLSKLIDEVTVLLAKEKDAARLHGSSPPEAEDDPDDPDTGSEDGSRRGRFHRSNASSPPRTPAHRSSSASASSNSARLGVRSRKSKSASAKAKRRSSRIIDTSSSSSEKENAQEAPQPSAHSDFPINPISNPGQSAPAHEPSSSNSGSAGHKAQHDPVERAPLNGGANDCPVEPSDDPGAIDGTHVESAQGAGCSDPGSHPGELLSGGVATPGPIQEGTAMEPAKDTLPGHNGAGGHDSTAGQDNAAGQDDVVEGDNTALPTEQRRPGRPRGSKPAAGAPTRSSKRLLASVPNSHPQVPDTQDPVTEGPQPDNVGRNTRSRSKSTSRNAPTTPAALSSPKKQTPKPKKTTNKPTPGSTAPKTRKKGGKM